MSMRALMCERFGGPETLVFRQIEKPEPGVGQVRIAVHAVAANFPDLLMIAGKYQFKPPFPFTPGVEAAGVVDAVGAGVTEYQAGDRVMARLNCGGLAEYACAAVASLESIPPDMGFIDAATFPIGYGTAYHALAERALLRAGEYLLVLGATGGVGLAAVELGKRMGAIVIAAGGNDKKLAVAREYGADYCLNYSREDIRDRVKEITHGAGADVVFDAVGGKAADQALRAMAWDARFIVVGFASGDIPDIPANRCLIKNARAVGVLWGAHAHKYPGQAKDTYRRLMALYTHGMLKPKISRVVSFEEARTALAALADRSVVGRTVVKIRD